MSKKIIHLDALSPSSIAAAINAIEDYAAKVKRLEEELPKALAEFGAVQAQAKYDAAPYNLRPSGWTDQPQITVTAEPTENGWRVRANGQEVCFVEFGAGVYYNGGNSSYLGTRPPGIVGIGEYGSGRGKQDMWAFGSPAEWTHGTPASNSLYYTAREIEARIEETARKILND